MNIVYKKGCSVIDCAYLLHVQITYKCQCIYLVRKRGVVCAIAHIPIIPIQALGKPRPIRSSSDVVYGISRGLPSDLDM